jgi:hypothetical protein
VGDAAAMPPTVSEPTHNHGICASAHAGGIRKLAKALSAADPGPAMASGHHGRQRRWFGATMGTMSASDAAPLPRLGEVFFDVRGNSRSMRLSWYADTGVAVLSIWQGGMCTGTFRLAIADLPRMVETLQRGPGGQQPGWDAEAPGQAFADAPGDATAQVRAMGPMSGQMMQPAPPDFPDGRDDQGEYRNGATEYLAEPADRRGGSGQYPAEPDPRPGPAGYPAGPLPDRRGAAPDYLAGPPDSRGGAPDYLAEPTDPGPGPAGYPAGPPPDRRGAAPDYLAGPPDSRGGAPDYLAGPPDSRGGPSEYPAGPPDPRGGSGQYPAEPPSPRPGPAGFPGEPQQPDRRAGTPDYLADPLETLGQLGVPEPPRTASAPYQTGSREYLAEPQPDQRNGSAEYLTGPSDYPAGPPEQRTEYLADLPAAPNAAPAGYGGDFHAGGSPSGSYPAAGDSGAYPRGTGRQAAYPGEPAGDPYLGGTGPADYQGEPPVSHYPRGSSAPSSALGAASRGDALGPSTADYPAHYGAAVTDDMGDEPPVESPPYQRRRGSR